MNMNMNQKGFANIVLIIVIVAIVAVGGYFVFSKKSATPTSTETQQTKTSNNGQGGNLINIPSDGTVIDNKNLSLYKNESCGFEISFPSQFVNWHASQKCPDTVPSYDPFKNYLHIEALSLKSRTDCNIDQSGESPAGCNYFNIVVTNSQITGPKIENISVDNISAEKLITGEDMQILIQFKKNNLWYRYTHTFSPSDIKEAEKLSDLIISTFKFTK